MCVHSDGALVVTSDKGMLWKMWSSCWYARGGLWCCPVARPQRDSHTRTQCAASHTQTKRLYLCGLQTSTTRLRFQLSESSLVCKGNGCKSSYAVYLRGEVQGSTQYAQTSAVMLLPGVWARQPSRAWHSAKAMSTDIVSALVFKHGSLNNIQHGYI